MPDQPAASCWWKSPEKSAVIVSIAALVVSGIAVIVSAIDALADWRSATAAIGQLNQEMMQLNEEDARHQREGWAKVQVFQIIERGTKQRAGDSTAIQGITYDEIKRKYELATLVTTEVELTPDARKDLELQKILLDLITNGVIYQLVDDSYMIQRSALNQRADRFYLEERAKYAILNELAQRPGMHKVSELYQTIQDNKILLTVEEYNLIINQLIASNAVLIDDAGMLYAVSNPPPKRKSPVP